MGIKTGLYIVQSIFSSGSCKTMMSNSQELSFSTGEICDSKAGGKNLYSLNFLFFFVHRSGGIKGFVSNKLLSISIPTKKHKEWVSGL